MSLADEPDLTRELDAAEAIVTGRETPETEIQRLRDHIDADHRVMVQLGRIAESAVQMLEHISMDTDEDREFHARAVGALRGRLDEMAATMKEANEAAGTICRCALEKGRMLHRGDCPLYPGEPLRMTAAQFREIPEDDLRDR